MYVRKVQKYCIYLTIAIGFSSFISVWIFIKSNSYFDITGFQNIIQNVRQSQLSFHNNRLFLETFKQKTRNPYGVQRWEISNLARLPSKLTPFFITTPPCCAVLPPQRIFLEKKAWPARHRMRSVPRREKG